MKIEIEATPEEMAVLLCELKAEIETVPDEFIKNTGTTIEDVLGGSEFYREQKTFGPLKGTGSPQENLKRLLLDIAGEYGIKF